MKLLVCGLALLALAACGGGSSGNISGGILAEKRSAVVGPGRCGIDNAWTVREVAGVRLSQPAIVRIETAEALERWLVNSALPAIGRRGGGLAEVKVAAHYSCRTRNNRPGAKLSEHALGNAIDISAFVLKDGSRITVLDGWNSKDGGLLKKLHRGACGPFGTVLGPNADRHHRDHFHFDIANHRGGPYCR